MLVIVVVHSCVELLVAFPPLKVCMAYSGTMNTSSQAEGSDPLGPMSTAGAFSNKGLPSVFRGKHGKQQ